MAFSDSWVESDPDGDIITVSLLDDSDRLIKRAVRERLEGDAVDPLTGLIVSGSFPSAPKPKQGSGRVHAVTEAGVAALANEDGRLAVTTDTKRLFHIAAAGDAELDYVPSTGTPKTITAVNTFNPGVAGPAFILGANAQDQFINGLDADRLDSQEGSFYQDASNLNAGTIPDARLPSPPFPIGGNNSLVTHTGVTTESGTLRTVTVPGGKMKANGWLRVTVGYSKGGAISSATIRVKLGGSTVQSIVIDAAVHTGFLEVMVRNINGENVQRTHVVGKTSGSTTAIADTGPETAVDSAMNQAVTVTAQLTFAADSVTISGFMVEAAPVA